MKNRILKRLDEAINRANMESESDLDGLPINNIFGNEYTAEAQELAIDVEKWCYEAANDSNNTLQMYKLKELVKRTYGMTHAEIHDLIMAVNELVTDSHKLIRALRDLFKASVKLRFRGPKNIKNPVDLIALVIGFETDEVRVTLLGGTCPAFKDVAGFTIDSVKPIHVIDPAIYLESESGVVDDEDGETPALLNKRTGWYYDAYIRFGMGGMKRGKWNDKSFNIVASPMSPTESAVDTNKYNQRIWDYKVETIYPEFSAAKYSDTGIAVTSNVTAHIQLGQNVAARAKYGQR